ncbi:MULTISPECIES: uridine kinase [unclassified Microbacterium]|uniref:uridine kinase n=1 Tax=unclassified Microbacterium TaxID=2609290 RepID=UPI00214B7720|nr:MULTISPECIES: uridine kinase [unclassified Microbacterium]MCR2786057.1 uridine kinase [Microbacterium sp. zg.B96]WIM16912.1 uridine kinase [Microbacterium sp. zg-B96]
MPQPTAPALWRDLHDEVRQHLPRGRVIIAVDGIDGAGKTWFADGLATAFTGPVLRASVDGFHRPRAERYARGRTSPEGFYRDSYDYDTFRRTLIDPFRAGAPLRTAVWDVDRDEPVDVPPQTAPEDAVLIVDGIFLHRPELRGLWNWSLWLDVPVDVAFARMAERDGTDPDPSAASNRRYRQGQELYLREADPRQAASAIIDNTDWDHPQRTYRDFC